MSFLVVDTADDAILAECESAKDVLPILGQVQKERPQREVRVVWFGTHQGELVSTQSLVSVRAMSNTEGIGLWGGWRSGSVHVRRRRRSGRR